MLKKGSTTYTWIRGRRLASAVKGGTTTTYAYDHTGTRVKKTVGSMVTEFRMAGSLLMSQKAGSTVTYFAYDSSGQLIGMSAGSNRYYYIRNAQNDITGIIDDTGALVVQYRYDAWGKPVSTTGSLASTIGKRNPFRYRGYYWDEETGLYYVGSRYYDPEIRRFISADDVDILISDHSSIIQTNLYTYCESNPVNRLDDSGYISISNLLKVGAAAAIVVGLAVATVVTAGTASIITGAALSGALSGGLGGAITGAITGGISGGMKGAVDGACSGLLHGTIIGGATSAAISGFSIASGAVKVVGKAQSCKATFFHRAASNIEAGKMTAQPWRYSKVFLNRGLKTAGLVGRQRPDVIGIARFGKNTLVEVVSKTQTGTGMYLKCLKMMSYNPNTGKKIVRWAGWIVRTVR